LWKILSESVLGTSHERFGKPCQDRCLALASRPVNEEFLIVACADGAGSAARSEVGAAIACETVIQQLCDHLTDSASLEGLTREFFLSVFRAALTALTTEAGRLEIRERDLACTLLVAVVGEEEAVFAQIGDGAIVVSVGAGYEIVFWPDRGEYADTTTFLTSPGLDEALQYSRRDGTDALAVFTDGLQSLALNYSDRTAFSGFFDPMMTALRAADDSTDLVSSFRAFLQSEAVNRRTDDDKSLVLAVRAISDRAAG
jgi:hypothetical protein